MNTNLSKRMTLLGLAAMGFYAALLASGTVGTDVMPQFIASALVFLSSGRLLRKPAVQKSDDEDEKPQQEKPELDWDRLTPLLNWGMSMLIISGMAIWVMKPTDVTFVEALLSLVPTEKTYVWVGGLAP
ncbi:MAG TPA: hypothetical protein VGA63_03790 [Geopsychrobacteraceae bacterium]